MDKQKNALEPLDRTIAGLVLALQRTLSIEDLTRIYHAHLSAYFLHAGVRVHLMLEKKISCMQGKVAKCRHRNALSLGKERMGEVIVFRSTVFSRTERAMLTRFSTSLFFPLRNALLYEKALREANRDPLTGLRNRLSLQSDFEQEMALSTQIKTPLSSMVIDLDHFKRINDSYGHHAGDQILLAVGKRILLEIRRTDIAYRYGGEEFIVLLRNTGMKKALAVADRIISKIRKSRFSLDKKSVQQLTVSIGIAEYCHDESVQEFIARADTALYRAKNAGRDQTMYDDQ